MSDSTQGIEEVETQPIAMEQQEPMPSSKEPTVTEQEPQQEQQAQEEGLPEEASDRTRKNFARILEENRTLKEEREAREASEASKVGTVFDIFNGGQMAQPQMAQPPIQYQNLNPHQINEIKSDFVDEQGNVDVNGLRNALNAANQNVASVSQDNLQTKQQLNQLVQNIRLQEQTRQTQELLREFPELNPVVDGKKNKEFDQTFHQLIRDRLVSNVALGVNKSASEVARDIRTFYKPSPKVNVEKAKDEAVAEFKQTLDKRNQGPIESGVGSKRQEEDFVAERAKTRKENIFRGAPTLTERLRRATNNTP